MEHVADAFFPTRFGNFRIHAFRDGNKEHLAIVMEGETGTPLIRIHSKCQTGDALCSLRCDCRDQLEAAMKRIASEKSGMLIYLDQEGRGIGLANKIRAYELQDEGMDTVEANTCLGFGSDERDYDAAAGILRHFRVKRVRILTNNPDKINGLEKKGIEVEERIPLIAAPTGYNGRYLKTKKDKMNHSL